MTIFNQLPEHSRFSFFCLVASSFIVSSLFFFILKNASKLNQRWLKKLLNVSALKSESNAIQLGGLPLSITFIVSLFIILKTDLVGITWTKNEYTIVYAWLLSSLFIITYGYLDDRYELKALIKLLFQSVSIVSFAYFTSPLLSQKYSIMVFLTISIFSFLVMNGSNLLDGLDSLCVKVTGATLFGFAIIAQKYNSSMSFILTILMLAPISSFYFFNKEPAKIHLGEIGSIFIGYTYMLIACLIYYRTRHSLHLVDGLSYILIPLSLSIVELGVSFLRRILNHQTPFRGDRLHIHHILKNKYNLSASIASTIIGGFQMITTTISILISFHTKMPLLFLSFHFLAQVGIYFWIGKRWWFTKTESYGLRNLAKFLLKKEVVIIPSDAFSHFDIQILKDDEVSKLDHTETNYDFGQKKKKKSA